jgi:hypothetical protein
MGTFANLAAFNDLFSARRVAKAHSVRMPKFKPKTIQP